MGRNGRLTRSLTNRVLGGVCGGIGAYTGLNPLWIRLLFLLMIPTTVGYGFVLYLVLWLVLPVETLDELPPLTRVRPGDDPPPSPPPRGGSLGQLALGVGAMLLGVVLLVLVSGVLPVPAGDLFLPVAALSIGAALVWRQLRGV